MYDRKRTDGKTRWMAHTQDVMRADAISFRIRIRVRRDEITTRSHSHDFARLGFASETSFNIQQPLQSIHYYLHKLFSTYLHNNRISMMRLCVVVLYRAQYDPKDAPDRSVLHTYLHHKLNKYKETISVDAQWTQYKHKVDSKHRRRRVTATASVLNFLYILQRSFPPEHGKFKVLCDVCRVCVLCAIVLCFSVGIKKVLQPAFR